MAEIVTSVLLNLIFEKLADEALKKLVRSQRIHSELKSLERTLSQIRALLTDASHKQITDKAVKQWLNSLQHLAYDIDDVLDDLATQVMHRELTRESGAITTKVRKLVPTCCTNILLSSRLLGKLDDINTKLQDLEKEKLTLGLVVKDKIPTNMSRSNETSLPEASRIVGREGEKQKLLNKLLGDDESCKNNFSIVPIVGMGGIGKTTLARLLYNETQVSESDHFQLKAWVCVPQEFDLFKISKTIFQAVTRENRDFEDLNQVQVALMNQLKEKRFLLVLDDIWSENYHDWENLVRPFHSAAPGSKIIMTTRKEQLLKKLGFDHLDHLGSLSHDDALSLFAFHALGVDNFDSHPTLKSPGDGIVRKCGGLPLALGAVGRVLRTKTDKEDWDDVLNSEIWDLENANEIIPALRLSYQDLHADLKQLFAYCSLFPKGFLFNKEELVLLWMAEGFLNQSTSSKSLERLGLEYFENLLSRSFFELSPNEESLFVMHDLMNDLSTFVAGEFFLKFDDQTEMETGKEALAKHRYMSFIRKEYVGCHKYVGFLSDRSLRTLLATSIEMDESWNAFYFSNQIFPYLLRAFPLLRVLSFSGFCIEEVPEFIGSLKLLRYLNLSRTKIKELPEYVGNLYNLQTLIVFGCRSLTKLPKSFLKLNKLRHFDIRDTPLLKNFPFGISELKSLQTLTKIIIGGDSGFAITKLQGLKNLRGKFCIEGLEKVESITDAREAHLSQKTLTELELKWGDEFDDSRKQTLEKEVLNELKPHCEKLKKLAIVSYGGIEFPKWVGDPSFHWLVHVSIRCCRKCTSLPALGALPFLKELFIEGMNEVKVIDSEFLGTTGVAFPSLEILRFKDMLGWEVWSTNRGDANVDVVFPFLRELQIKNCTNLVDISVQALPSLRVLKIYSCGYGVLDSLLQAASSVTNLKIKSISRLTDEAWRGVIHNLGAVEEVKIKSCDGIRYLWESKAKASEDFKNLKELMVFGCSSLVSLGEKEDDFGSLSSLRILQLWFCTSMDHCCCPGSIESLHIFASSVTSISFSGGGQNLKTLQLVDCNKLIEKIDITSLPMLEYVHIVHWPNLKSIIELSTFIHVKFLMIKDCQNLESFPHLQLPKLTSLEFLEITNCPSMDASFPCGLWPPNLHSLEIGGLKKPISEWGPQNFPTSLVHVQLSHEHVTDFSQLSHLLPSSLTSLRLREFENLESLLVGLQHLTSLQELVIDKCPKMIHLPETLLPSLFKLILIKCPNLDKMFQERPSHYVPLVSNIPCFLKTKEEVHY